MSLTSNYQDDCQIDKETFALTIRSKIYLRGKEAVWHVRQTTTGDGSQWQSEELRSPDVPGSQIENMDERNRYGKRATW